MNHLIKYIHNKSNRLESTFDYDSIIVIWFKTSSNVLQFLKVLEETTSWKWYDFTNPTSWSVKNIRIFLNTQKAWFTFWLTASNILHIKVLHSEDINSYTKIHYKDFIPHLISYNETKET